MPGRELSTDEQAKLDRDKASLENVRLAIEAIEKDPVTGVDHDGIRMTYVDLGVLQAREKVLVNRIVKYQLIQSADRIPFGMRIRS